MFVGQNDIKITSVFLAVCSVVEREPALSTARPPGMHGGNEANQPQASQSLKLHPRLSGSKNENLAKFITISKIA